MRHALCYSQRVVGRLVEACVSSAESWAHVSRSSSISISLPVGAAAPPLGPQKENTTAFCRRNIYSRALKEGKRGFKCTRCVATPPLPFCRGLSKNVHPGAGNFSVMMQNVLKCFDTHHIRSHVDGVYLKGVARHFPDVSLQGKHAWVSVTYLEHKWCQVPGS